MTTRDGLSAEELEDLVYKVICWLKKWVLWDGCVIFSRGKAFSSYNEREHYREMAERKQSGWRNWEDVWVWDYGFEELCQDLQDVLDEDVLAIECGGTLQTMLLEKIYTADFYSLPDAARICLLRNIYLFESSESWWYEAYLKDGVRLDDTEFDSFDEYRELESDNREEFKLDVLEECLSSLRLLFHNPEREGYSYNRAVAKLILGELDEILKPYHLRRWVDPYSELPLCIG